MECIRGTVQHEHWFTVTMSDVTIAMHCHADPGLDAVLSVLTCCCHSLSHSSQVCQKQQLQNIVPAVSEWRLSYGGHTTHLLTQSSRETARIKSIPADMTVSGGMQGQAVGTVA